ncbi:MAG: pitrilysin family protein [Bacteroidota bacterium]
MLQIAFQTRILSNGLKVIVHEDHAVPKVVVDILYQVGSKDENPELTGFAHLFEHLMFEGSKHIPSYDTPLQRVGGQNNAFTTPDITNYYLTVPANQLETAFWLESDRMLELAFSQEKLDIQKSVVIEEYKQRYLNQPYGDAHLKLRSIHYQKHPYRWPTIGKDISHIEEATLTNVKDFFYQFYAPNNATLVVAGSVNPEEVYQLAEKWFGGIPQRKLGKKTLPIEPTQKAPRHMDITGKVPFPAVYKMFHMPAQSDPDYYVADILTDLLSNGKSGILYQKMVREKQIASQASSFTWGLHHPGIISLDAKIAENHSLEEYENALQEVIEEVCKISEEELERMKKKLSASFIMQKAYLLNKTMALAMYDSLGDVDLINQTPALYESITLDQVQAAARKYFDKNNCSTLYYLPESRAN